MARAENKLNVDHLQISMPDLPPVFLVWSLVSLISLMVHLLAVLPLYAPAPLYHVRFTSRPLFSAALWILGIAWAFGFSAVLALACFVSTIISLDLPSTPCHWCEQFSSSFCDRLKDLEPNIINFRFSMFSITHMEDRFFGSWYHLWSFRSSWLSHSLWLSKTLQREIRKRFQILGMWICVHLEWWEPTVLVKRSITYQSKSQDRNQVETLIWIWRHSSLTCNNSPQTIRVSRWTWEFVLALPVCGGGGIVFTVFSCWCSGSHLLAGLYDFPFPPSRALIIPFFSSGHDVSVCVCDYVCVGVCVCRTWLQYVKLLFLMSVLLKPCVYVSWLTTLSFVFFVYVCKGSVWRSPRCTAIPILLQCTFCFVPSFFNSCAMRLLRFDGR